MTVEIKATKQAIQDKLESQIKSIEAKLDTLKARAETAKASAEIKAIGELTSRRVQLHQKFEKLQKSGESNWEQTKKNLESDVAEFEKAVKNLEAKVHTH